MPRWEELAVFVTAPVINGATLTPRRPDGCRAVALTTAVTAIALTGDVFLQQPDGAAAAGVDMIGWNMLRVFADGADIALLFGANSLTPDPAATSASSPANVCERIPAGTYVDYMVSAKEHPYMCVRAVTGTPTVRYRLSAPVSSAK